jgi:hypothetical protein
MLLEMLIKEYRPSIVRQVLQILMYSTGGGEY